MELPQKALRTYRRGGTKALLGESKRYILRHPAHIIPRARIRARVSAYRQGYSKVADPFKLIYVNPSDIRQMDVQTFNKYTDIGLIRSGKWDLNNGYFNDHPKYNAVRERFEQGATWEETGIYEHLMEKINEEGRADGCYSLSDLHKRYEHIDSLYHSINKDGYQIHKSDSPSESDLLDQICVSIGGDGQLIFNGGGFHRLSIAKVLGLDNVPVRVVVRHSRWQEKRERAAYSANIPSQDINCIHPDLIET